MGDIDFILSVINEDINNYISNTADRAWKVSSFAIEKKLMVKAFEHELENKYRTYYRHLLCQKEAEDSLPSLSKVNELEISVKIKRESSRYLFITINPHNMANDKAFMSASEKAFKKSWIKSFLYVIEQRGETEEELGKGFHLHAIVDKGDYRLSHAIREFASTYGKYCDVNNPHCFNIVYCAEGHIPRRMNYILGKKNDEAKWKKQEMDIIYRKENGFKPYYGNKEYFEDINDYVELSATKKE